MFVHERQSSSTRLLRVESPSGSSDSGEGGYGSGARASEGENTPLDDAIDRIGLGRYQISLL